MFKITTTAAQQVLSTAKQGGTEELPLRLAAHQKPDGSVDYRMGFDDVTDEDIRISSEGIDIVMAPEYVPLLAEATMDFVEIEPGQFHFIFLNPKDANYSPPDAG
ncbi:HesB/IscA family protein [Candidatus Thiosymbion oneisti]|uniref:HesB/IscA family protein n=1 Tax=Candidatus Thiosymbion oneisti TaxID=589554 RepID=UPI001060853E|nr:iron-sulfur cluster assembly accessory protein [Candidatus Thiosymbion oneisti]